MQASKILKQIYLTVIGGGISAVLAGCVVTPEYQVSPGYVQDSSGYAQEYQVPPDAGEMADLNVSAEVPPPPLQLAAPPEMVVVPSGNSYVYMVPNLAGVYFYQGAWFR